MHNKLHNAWGLVSANLRIIRRIECSYKLLNRL